jgi:Flp pilus assembly protein protease CpaA
MEGGYTVVDSQISVQTFWLLVAVTCDLRWRRVPNWLTVAGFLGGQAGAVAGWWEWSWIGFTVMLAGVFVCGFRGGDVKTAAILGGVMTPLMAVWTLGLSFGITLAAWHHCHGIDRPFPWTVYLLGGYVGVTVVTMTLRVTGFLTTS